MLDDTPRKLLRIMYHFSGHFRRMPTLPELERLSGRKPGSIKDGMRQLGEQNYIQWNSDMPVQTAVIIEGWERDNWYNEESQTGPRKPQQTSTPGNTDYWTNY